MTIELGSRGHAGRRARVIGRTLRALGIAAVALGLSLGGAAAAAAPPTLPPSGAAVVETANIAGAELVATGTTRAPIQRPAGMETDVHGPAPAPQPEPVAPPAPADPEPELAPEPAPRVERRATPSPRLGSAPGEAPRVANTKHNAGGLTASSATKAERPFPHKGAVGDLRLGALGCIRRVCSDGHDATPGFRVDGFVGGNIRGFVELGLAGGWGMLSPRIAPNTNVLALYGLDPAALQSTLLGAASSFVDLDLGSMAVTGTASLRSTQVGPVMRIHFVPWGRMTAFVGSGIEYNLFRSRYETTVGQVRLDFHGLAVPIEAGLGVYVHEHIALVTQFDYRWTWYGLAVLDHPDRRLALPVSTLQTAAESQGSDLRGELPQFWSVGFGIRGRM